MVDSAVRLDAVEVWVDLVRIESVGAGVDHAVELRVNLPWDSMQPVLS